MDNRHNAITATYYLERKKQEKLASGIKEQSRTKWFSRLKQTEKTEAKKREASVPPRPPTDEPEVERAKTE